MSKLDCWIGKSFRILNAGFATSKTAAMDHAIGFACGFAYGTTSVLIGQPFDTVKTRMQAMHRVAGVSTFQVRTWLGGAVFFRC